MSTTPKTESAMRSLLSQPLMMEPRAAMAAMSRAAVKMSLSSQMPTMMGVPTKSRLLTRVGAALILSIRGPVMCDEMDAYWMDGTHTRAIVAACHEASVDSSPDVILDLDTPGGTMRGSDDVVEAIRMLAATKRVHAIAHDEADSAGYLYATAATRILATKSATVGSIGVILRVTDMSKMLADFGVSVHNVKTGAFKDAGDPSQPIGEDVLGYFQTLTDSMGMGFFEAVSASRGITVDAVKSMQAAVFTPESALRAGLIDAIVPFDAYVKAVSGGAWSDGCTDEIETCVDDLPDADDDGIIDDDSSEPDAAARAGSQTPAALESTMSDKDNKGPGVPVPKIETAAQLRANHPELVAEIEASARAAGAEKPATIAQLKAIAPGEELASFRESCLEANATPTAATALYAKRLADENTTLRANAKAVTLTPGQAALAAEGTGRAEAIKQPGSTVEGDACLTLIKAGIAKGMSVGKAVEAAASANPTAHAKWVQDGCPGLDKLT